MSSYPITFSYIENIIRYLLVELNESEQRFAIQSQDMNQRYEAYYKNCDILEKIYHFIRHEETRLSYLQTVLEVNDHHILKLENDVQNLENSLKKINIDSVYNMNNERRDVYKKLLKLIKNVDHINDTMDSDIQNAQLLQMEHNFLYEIYDNHLKIGLMLNEKLDSLCEILNQNSININELINYYIGF